MRRSLILSAGVAVIALLLLACHGYDDVYAVREQYFADRNQFLSRCDRGACLSNYDCRSKRCIRFRCAPSAPELGRGTCLAHDIAVDDELAEEEDGALADDAAAS